ncbi:hypothetical protein QFZ76_005463 [Streptomyces sp. V4I2]|nr:hypothetical protein [Streptomyces sp. V4I2]
MSELDYVANAHARGLAGVLGCLQHRPLHDEKGA